MLTKALASKDLDRNKAASEGQLQSYAPLIVARKPSWKWSMLNPFFIFKEYGYYHSSDEHDHYSN